MRKRRKRKVWNIRKDFKRKKREKGVGRMYIVYERNRKKRKRKINK